MLLLFMIFINIGIVVILIFTIINHYHQHHHHHHRSHHHPDPHPHINQHHCNLLNRIYFSRSLSQLPAVIIVVIHFRPWWPLLTWSSLPKECHCFTQLLLTLDFRCRKHCRVIKYSLKSLPFQHWQWRKAGEVRLILSDGMEVPVWPLQWKFLQALFGRLVASWFSVHLIGTSPLTAEGILIKACRWCKDSGLQAVFTDVTPGPFRHWPGCSQMLEGLAQTCSNCVLQSTLFTCAWAQADWESHKLPSSAFQRFHLTCSRTKCVKFLLQMVKPLTHLAVKELQ